MKGLPKVEMKVDVPTPEPLLLTPEQAAARLAICRTRIYELMGSGQLESVRIGSSRRIPTAVLVEFVQQLRSVAQISTEAGAEHGPFSVDRGAC
jgi:excisionase family DNA binding protein